MLHKYCPNCGALDYKELPNGLTTCSRCKYQGAFKEGSMDEINNFQKTLKTKNQQNQLETNPKEKTKPNQELQNKLKALKGTKTRDFEIL